MSTTSGHQTTGDPEPARPRKRLRRTGCCVLTVSCCVTLLLVSHYLRFVPGGVTLRLILATCDAVESSLSGRLPSHTVHTATAWLCWVPTLLIALRSREPVQHQPSTNKGN